MFVLKKGDAAMNTLEDLYYGNLFPREKCASKMCKQHLCVIKSVVP